MTTKTAELVLAFNGTKKIQTAAAAVFNTLRVQGAFMSDNAIIRVSLDALVEHLGETTKVLTDAISQNPEVFVTETDGDSNVVVLTTRVGRAPLGIEVPSTHSLSQRLMTPEPKPAPRPRPVREVVRTNDAWATYVGEAIEDEGEDEADFGFAEPVVEIEPPAQVVVTEAAASEIFVEEPREVEEPAAAKTDVVAATDDKQDPAEEALKAAEPIKDVRPEIPVFEEVVQPAAPARSFGQATDFSEVPEDVIAAALDRQLGNHGHVASFGGRWMTTDRAHRLSRGNIRDIRQFIEEQEQPLTDQVIVEDVLRVRPGNAEYANTVFGLNYWLRRERDFQFVGSRDQRFWSISDLPPLGTTLRKPNDIGSDYRYLTDGVDSENVGYRSVQSVDHVVTFYEWNLGLLPYDEDMQKLLPAPMLSDQRSAVFTFEIPQLYTTYLVELRYPTPTRGGFFLGLDDLYFDSLVPGAIISVNATENDGHFKVEYIEGDEQTNRLLEIEEKRPRYHFRDTSFACGVDDSWLLSEDRFPRLNGTKPMTDRDRRKISTVVEVTFERIGMEDGNGGYLAPFEDLIAAINIERPVSEKMLRREIDVHTHMSGDDASGYTYAPE